MIEVPDDATIVAAVREALPDVVGIWFYGSAAIGRAGPQSDLDIGVLGPRTYDFQTLLDAFVTLMEPLGADRIDLVDLRSAGLPLRFGVFGEGRRLWAADAFIADSFENSSVSMFQRDRMERRYDIEARLQRFGRGFNLTGADR